MKYFLTGLGILAVDQIAKFSVVANLTEGQSIPLLPPVLNLTYVLNPGAAFGMFANETWLLLLAAVVAVGLAWYFRRDLAKQDPLLKWGVVLALAGTIGNFIDRLRFQAVVDFIDIPIWPIFNVADMAIVAGVALLFWEVLTSGKESQA